MEDFQLTLQRLRNVEQENIILREIIEKFEEKNRAIQTKIDILECRLGNSVFLPGYHGGVIPKNISELSLNFTQKRSGEYFTGRSLEPLSALSELEKILFWEIKPDFYSLDFTPLASCKKLNHICITKADCSNSLKLMPPDLGPAVKVYEIWDCQYKVKFLDH